MKTLVSAALAATFLLATPALAQADSKYTLGPLWYVTSVHVEDGQFENYMDFLADKSKKQHDFAIKGGVELSYHFLAVDAKRAGEPDILIVVTSKDYLTVAQQLDYEAKLNKAFEQDRRIAEAGAAKRLPMRKIMGDMELRELVVK